MRRTKPRRRTTLGFQLYWAAVAGLYAIWFAAMGYIALLPERQLPSQQAMAITGLAEAHQDSRTLETVVVRQVRRP